MIKKKDIGLVVDTNILIDIIESSDPSATFIQQLVDWIKKIVSGMDSHPHGKKVTLFVDKRVLDDYSTGLSHSGNKQSGKQIRYIFEKNTSIIRSVVSDYDIDLSLRMISKGQMTPASKRRVSDRSDEKFFVLLEHILNNRGWKDWAIILASRDKTTFYNIRDHIGHVKKLCLVNSKSQLDQTIEC